MFPLQPMPLQKRRVPFDGSDWVFELKYDGFRALARVDHGRTQLISRNGNTFASFQELQQNIGASLPNDSVVLDGEIVCLDRKGRPRFKTCFLDVAIPASLSSMCSL